MMTLDQLKEAMAKELPVVIHNPEFPHGWSARMVGIIIEISDTITDKQTYQEPCVWIKLPDCRRVFKFAHEIRLAKLKKPLVFKSSFTHTSSNKYSGNDMREPF